MMAPLVDGRMIAPARTDDRLVGSRRFRAVNFAACTGSVTWQVDP